MLFAGRNWASGSEVPLLDPVIIAAARRCCPITLQDVAGAASPLRALLQPLLLGTSAAGLMMGKSDLDDLLSSYKCKSSECVEPTRAFLLSSLLFSPFLSFFISYCSTGKNEPFFFSFFKSVALVTSDFKPKPGWFY